jgi:hypothetical protein
LARRIIVSISSLWFVRLSELIMVCELHKMQFNRYVRRLSEECHSLKAEIADILAWPDLMQKCSAIPLVAGVQKIARILSITLR